jgi:hypothetical protein
MYTLPLSVLVLLLLLVAACSAQKPWQPDEFPIGYWYGPPIEHNTAEAWRTVADCKFTFNGMSDYDRADSLKMLDYCQQAGIKAMVWDPRTRVSTLDQDDWQAVLAQVVADYGRHPALLGYFLADEPNYGLFGPLAKLSQELARLDPAHLPFINLFPTYASIEQLGNPTFADHLDKFLTIVKPVVLSYDHYALMNDGTDRPDWYENLTLIRDYGLRYNTPPWVVILSLPHLGYRDPTAAEMRWQVYTALAYGMKGIMYYTYWSPPGGEQSGEIAIVDSQGKPARLYPVVAQLNGEIQVLGKTLLGLTSTGVYHTGPTPLGATRLGTDEVLSTTTDRPLVIGLFRDPGGVQYALVANADHRAAVDAEFTLRPYVTAVAEVSAADGQPKPLALKEGKLALHLAAGDGKLLRLTSNFVYPEPPPTLREIGFEFNRDGELEGWVAANSLADPVVKDGTLTVTITGNDPHMIRSYMGLAPDQYSTLVVRMKLPPCDPEGQVFWTTGDSAGFADDKYLNFPVQPDGEWHEYRIPVGTHAMWKGKGVRALRLDPTVGGAQPGSKVEIDYLRGE